MFGDNLRFSASLISNPKNSSGVCSFRINYDETIDPGVSITAEVANTGRPLQAFKGGRNKILGLHTHLLADGAHEVRFGLIKNGKKLAEIKEKLSLDVREGLFEVVRNEQLKSNTKLFFEGGCDSSMYPYESGELIQPWFDRKDAHSYLDAQLNKNAITSQEYQYLSNFVESGFIEIEGLIDDSLIDLVNKEIDDAIDSGYQGYEKLSSQRLEQLHEHYPNIESYGLIGGTGKWLISYLV